MHEVRRTNFDERAASWDEDPGRVKLADNVADTIIREINPTQQTDVMDFGCGSGLVTLRLQPYVKSITGVDSSHGMLGILNEKVRIKSLQNVSTQFVDFELGGKPEGSFHLIVSSMALHHVEDTAAVLKKFYDLILPGGSIAIADLDKEDGSFHGDNTGVFHFGFDRKYLKGLFEKTGFSDVRDTTAANMIRESEDNVKHEFSVFLITGKK